MFSEPAFQTRNPADNPTAFRVPPLGTHSQTTCRTVPWRVLYDDDYDDTILDHTIDKYRVSSLSSVNRGLLSLSGMAGHGLPAMPCGRTTVRALPKGNCISSLGYPINEAVVGTGTYLTSGTGCTPRILCMSVAWLLQLQFLGAPSLRHHHCHRHRESRCRVRGG